MKVLDLQCSNGHAFEGWFGSEADFQTQHAGGLVACPMCGDHGVVKKPSAPRLSLSGHGASEVPARNAVERPREVSDLTAAWMAVARHVLANSADVGHRFAEEARKMHYGETLERSIRGKTSPEEARELLEEGIAVMPLLLPDALKEPLQ